MSFQVDVWLRGTDVATTATLENVTNSPASWGDDDVRLILEGMLRAMHWLKHRTDEDVPVSLRRGGYRDRNHDGRGDRRTVRHRQDGAGTDDRAGSPAAKLPLDVDPLNGVARMSV
jgi:hypothetical protein